MTRIPYRYRLRRAMVSALVVALATVLGTACSRDDPAFGRPESSPPVLGHVHGLGIDPLDGRLYIATHHGLFRDGAAGLEKVGTSAAADRDLMGFLVAGPGVFLASGHPSPREAAPNPLGLVRSTDGGLSWQTVALGGEVDFHALDQGPEGIYGVDAEGSLRFSRDSGAGSGAAGRAVGQHAARVLVLLGDSNDAAAALHAGVLSWHRKQCQASQQLGTDEI